MFANRIEAGQKLAAALADRNAGRPLVLGLPRGGMVVAAEVAKGLSGDLNLVLAKKLRAPRQPELAIGAVLENGDVSLNQEIVRHTGADPAYIETERLLRLQEMAAQLSLYRKIKPSADIQGRIVILVDDGLATGATMIAAVHSVVRARPQRLVVTVPVGPPEPIETLKNLVGVDEVVCLMTTADFQGVGQFYKSFHQTTDAEVMALLKE